jgi:predicted Rossmann fold flavoprotein
MNQHYDVIIIGAGAAGLMCAIEAGKRQRSVLVIEHTARIGEKIRISGGGRCNFTNKTVSVRNYISANPHFATSALSRYSPQHFLELIRQHGIAYHEKTLGQLFCDGSAVQIIEMLLKECAAQNVTIATNCSVSAISREGRFMLETSQGVRSCESLVMATGGLSIPKLGASSFGYDIARQFGLQLIPMRPALVPLTLAEDFGARLSGISAATVVSGNGKEFRENSLFTHRGLSGPAILQISSYMNEGDSIALNLLPDIAFAEILKAEQQGKIHLRTVLSRYLSNRFAEWWCETMCAPLAGRPLAEIKAKALASVAAKLHHWQLTPSGTEGYGKAEVTAGGVDTAELSSKTLEAKKVPGLFFIGELVDVTGWLGGYNFQWAWASAVAAGQWC